MATKAEDLIIMLKNVRLAFPNIFEMAQVGGKGKPAFSASFIMPPDHPDVAKVRELITQAAMQKWGDKASDTLRALIAADKVCLHNGDIKAQYQGYAGNLYVSARGYVRPLIIGQDPNVKLKEEDGKPYSGCYVNAQVAIWAMQNQHGKRVCAQLRGVQFLRDGEAFAGGVPSQPDDFEPVDAGADEDAPPVINADEWGDLVS